MRHSIFGLFLAFSAVRFLAFSVAYLKLTIVNDLLIVSSKEL